MILKIIQTSKLTSRELRCFFATWTVFSHCTLNDDRILILNDSLNVDCLLDGDFHYSFNIDGFFNLDYLLDLHDDFLLDRNLNRSLDFDFPQNLKGTFDFHYFLNHYGDALDFAFFQNCQGQLDLFQPFLYVLLLLLRVVNVRFLRLDLKDFCEVSSTVGIEIQQLLLVSNCLSQHLNLLLIKSYERG